MTTVVSSSLGLLYDISSLPSRTPYRKTLKIMWFSVLPLLKPPYTPPFAQMPPPRTQRNHRPAPFRLSLAALPYYLNFPAPLLPGRFL